MTDRNAGLEDTGRHKLKKSQEERLGKYAKADWYLTAVNQYVDQYGDVPPPWIYGPTLHPHSMGWRMGSGETHIMVLGEWVGQQKFSFEDRLAYVRRYPAPPRWYQWIVGFLWEQRRELKDSELEVYFKKLVELGFTGVDKFEDDFDRDDLD